MLRAVALAVLLPACSPALALDCTASDQTSLNMCAEKDFRTADGRLNALYRQVQGRLGNAAAADAATLLTAAQRDWLAFRDAECDFKASDSEGGSIHPMIVLACRTALTRRRIADLEAYLSCKVEDGDCPTAPAP